MGGPAISGPFLWDRDIKKNIGIPKKKLHRKLAAPRSLEFAEPRRAIPKRHGYFETERTERETKTLQALKLYALESLQGFSNDQRNGI